MKDSIILNREDGSHEEFVGGKDFVEAVAYAASRTMATKFSAFIMMSPLIYFVSKHQENR